MELRIAKITDDGELDFASLEEQFADGKVKLLAVTHMSNVLGSYTPAERLAAFAHERGAKILLDGAQAVVHRRVDVQAIDADFYVFSGHKLYGPTGIGVLYAKAELLEAMPPFLGGGDMIASVSYRQVQLGQAAGTVRGRHAGDHRDHRPGRGHRLCAGDRFRRHRRT